MAETKKTTSTATTKKAPAKKPAATKAAAPKAEPKKVEDNKPTTVAAPKVAKKATKQIKVTYTKSVIGYNKNQAKVLQSLGLKKLHSYSLLPDNAATRGMIHKVAHLVTVEEVK